MPKLEFLDHIKKIEDVSGRVNLTNIARHFCVDESVVSSMGVDLNHLSIYRSITKGLQPNSQSPFA